MTTPQPRRARWAVLLLVLLPLWLVVSGGGAIWFFLHRAKQQARVEQEHFVQNVSVPMLADDLKKLVELIGDRNGGSESAAKNLSATASMIEGLLGPSNTGYRIVRVRGPADWPLIHVTLHGKNPEIPAVWIVTSYDSRPGSPGAEANATGLAATLAAAQALAGDKLEMDLHFVFLPHANDPESPILETAAKCKELIATAGTPKALLCIEAMGAGEMLWLTSRDTSALPLGLVHGLGSVRGAEVACLGEDTDLASVLFETGLPAVRVATRPIITPAEPDNHLPAAPVVAASTGRLVELIRRCAASR